MIGFKLEARGIVPEDLKVGKPFSGTVSQWTEGSQEFLKFALLVPAGSGKPASFSGSSQIGGFIAAVREFTPEKIFRNIKDSKLLKICAASWDCRLWLSGDVTVNFHFQPDKSGMQNLQAFTDMLKSLDTKLGDQVVIGLCDLLDQFMTWCVAKKVTEAVGLQVTVDL